MSNKALKFNNGFTLIGTVLSLLIAVTTIILVIQLMTRAGAVADLGREKFIASNLAREGLELVRQIRDQNWFVDSDRSNWLLRGICIDNTDTGHQFSLDSATTQAGENVGDVANAQLYRNEATGIWSHDSSNTITPYTRILSVDCTSSEDDPSFITVTSIVTWSSRDKSHSVLIREKLYNWLP